jgi:hypothetical protein
MTIVSTQHKFIFVHVPKTAGTSVKQYFNRYASEADTYVLEQSGGDMPASRARTGLQKHSTAVQICNAVGSEAFEEFFKFSVTRNPFERAVSTYRFLKFSFRNWAKAAIMDEFETFEEFVVSDFFRGPGPGSIFRPQVRWLVNGEGKLCMDFICRIESLENDLAAVMEKLNLPVPTVAMGKVNVSGGDFSTIASELNSGIVVDAIQRRYARDFKLLRYPADPDEGVARSM